MLVAFNILVVLLVLLIAYWWGNQGLFSAIIHLVCVIVAGAIALALWEPVTVGLLLRGGFFDSYAWGFSLIGLFTVLLFVLRLATNRLVPANVHLPHWANLAGGLPVGAAAGVLSVGILLIGAGFVQSQREILGFVGYAVSSRTGQVSQVNSLWLPVHSWTAGFYGWASVTSLRSGRPLRHYSPDLDQLAASLVRDSALGGRGSVSLAPNAATIKGVYQCPDLGRCAVTVSFGRGALDFGSVLTLSAAQMRLIAWPQPQGSKAKPYVSFPLRWSQEVKDSGIKTFQFDDISHNITSISGRETADVTIEFPFPAELQPRFIQIKGTRFDFSRVERLDRAAYGQILSAAGGPARAAAPLDPGARRLDPGDITLTNSLRRVHVSTNTLPGTMNERGKFLTEGDAVFKKTRQRFSRVLLIKGIEEPADTKIIQVNASRGSSGDLYGWARERAGPQATPTLVDSGGNSYSAIGYIHEYADGTRILLDPGRGIQSMADLPHLPTAGTHKLWLVFRVTEGANIVGFRLGDVTIGTCNLMAFGKAKARQRDRDDEKEETDQGAG